MLGLDAPCTASLLWWGVYKEALRWTAAGRLAREIRVDSRVDPYADAEDDSDEREDVERSAANI